MEKSQAEHTQRKLPRGGRELPPTSPIRNMAKDVTSAMLRSEVALVRGRCRDADLTIERAHMLLDELEQSLLEEPCDEVEVAHEFLDSFDDVLGQLELIRVDEDVHMPPSFGFADPSILAEISATRENVNEAITRCRAAIDRLAAAAACGGGASGGIVSAHDEDEEMEDLTRMLEGSVQAKVRSATACASGLA